MEGQLAEYFGITIRAGAPAPRTKGERPPSGIFWQKCKCDVAQDKLSPKQRSVHEPGLFFETDENLAFP
jgi:hypothetical protein